MKLRLRPFAGLSFVLGFLISCTDPRDDRPLGPTRASLNQTVSKRRVTLDDRFDEITLSVPGFGGLYLNDAGELVVRMVGSRTPPGLVIAIREVLGGLPGKSGATIHVEPADYDFHTLRSYFIAFMADRTNRDALVLMDVDEVRNRVVVGVRDASAIARVRQTLAELGIPQLAVDVEVRRLGTPASTLQDISSPVIGGVQVQPRNETTLASHVCTGGFNVKLPADTTKLYLVTNAHCTTNTDSLGGDYLYQPDPFHVFPAARVALEYAEKSWVSMPSEPTCPSGALCRYADAAMFKYDNATTGALGRIARTLHYTDASHPLTLTRDTADFHITGELPAAYFVADQWMAKVGRTTGWSAGKIDMTCFTQYWDFSPERDYACQYRVYDAMNAGGTNFADHGDSGSPVFLPVYSEDDVYGGVNWLAGILYFAGPREDGKQAFIFSALHLLKTDLGSMITTPGGGCTPNQFLNACQ